MRLKSFVFSFLYCLFSYFYTCQSIKSNSNYCKIVCNDGKAGGHVLCGYEKGKVSEECSDYLELGINKESESIILQEMNTIRKAFAEQNPGGVSDMMKLGWDEELAVIAQAWSARCPTMDETDNCLKDSDSEDIGQNIGQFIVVAGSSLRTLDELVDIWAELPENPHEMRFFDQMVYPECTFVGCAWSVFSLSDSDVRLDVQRLICNFDAQLPEEYIFNTGAPCSKCPNKTHCDMDALCEYDHGETSIKVSTKGHRNNTTPMSESTTPQEHQSSTQVSEVKTETPIKIVLNIYNELVPTPEVQRISHSALHQVRSTGQTLGIWMKNRCICDSENNAHLTRVKAAMRKQIRTNPRANSQTVATAKPYYDGEVCVCSNGEKNNINYIVLTINTVIVIIFINKYY